ncbi:hypothetical protein [Novispirillum itersonii]|uniref:Uncharacterized protein n=1 Tax=Novispirillum itersonii TaxID=189 RepID=A0A7X0DLQ2_NOVIT|nr:hypothetical protein [Novispirillum itersonii]MBB6210196.1 hypothetical protein [Novispirillum itersonii]
MATLQQVLLEIPEHIAEGLANGTLERVGGVIRSKDGTIYAFLKEGEAFLETVEAGGTLPPALDNLSQLMNLSLGLQVLTLGVTVSGFALLNTKLKHIDRKLDDLARSTARLQGDLTWMQQVRNIERSADLLACLEDAHWREKTNRLASGDDLRRKLSTAHLTYSKLMSSMLAEARAHQDHEAYLSFFQCCALSGIAKTRFDWVFDGSAAAAETQREVTETLSKAQNEFLRPMREYSPQHLIRIPLEDIPHINHAKLTMTETIRRSESYIQEIEYCISKDISIKEWDLLSPASNEFIKLIPYENRISE